MNSPFGDYDKPNFCDGDGILTASTALKGVKVQCADFAQGEANKGDFIYCDPPYLPSSATSNFAGYSAGGFGMVSHVRLRDFALACGKAGATVVLSNADVPTARKLYAQEHGFRRQRLMIGRSINPNGKGRGAVGELLITLNEE
jgi:DNA adenine methylase